MPAVSIAVPGDLQTSKRDLRFYRTLPGNNRAHSFETIFGLEPLR